MVAVAQLVEHLVVVQAVAGPSPVSHPIYFEKLSQVYLSKNQAKSLVFCICWLSLLTISAKTYKIDIRT